MKKISFRCSWGQSNNELIQRYSTMTPNDKPLWKNICATEENPDCFIALQLPNFSKSNIIHFRREPDLIKKWPKNIKGKNVYDYSTNEKFHVCTWWLQKSYDELTSLKYSPRDLISAVSSDKYPWRYKYIQEATKHNPKIIGRGSPLDGKRINLEDRTSLLLDSSMSICIENSSQPNYFTEKIIDALLAWCMPLYWGCPNIEDFFPEGSYRLIDIKSPEMISDLINQPITSAEINAMHEARNLILNKYNIWECIYKTLIRCSG
jgi:hypothetical protein